MKKNPTDFSDTRDVLAAVKRNAIATSIAAREVFEALRSGTISVADATELSNALGKANGADGNAVKAVMTEMVLDKMELAYATKSIAPVK
jgi:hypothetical protein